MTAPTQQAGDTRPTGAVEPRDQLDALAAELTTLRTRLATIDYRAAVLRLLVGADDQRHLDVASSDLDHALRAFRTAADAVVQRSSEAGAAFGVRPEERTLAILAERAPDQWRQDLRAQTKALTAETARLRERLRSDHGLVNSGHRQLTSTLQLLLGEDQPPVTYEAAGAAGARLVDHLA